MGAAKKPEADPPRRTEAEILAALDRLKESAPEEPEPVKVYPPAPQGKETPEQAAERLARQKKRLEARRRLVVEDLDRIEAEDVEWLWPGRIPLGSPTVILGRQGDGKSTVLSWIAANVTKGGAWPDVPDDNPPGSVLILQAEENAANAIRPRMDAFGFVHGKVGIVKGTITEGEDEVQSFNLGLDCKQLADECERRKDARLIIVDPVDSYIRGISGYNAIELRAYLAPLYRVAEDFRVAVVLAVHPNKNSDNDILDRAGGSGAITQMARMSWYLSEDPTDRSRRLLSLMKENTFGTTETAIAVHYDKRRRRITWFTEPVALKARQVDHLLQKADRESKLNVRPGPDPAARVKAQELILGLLEAGPMMLSSAQDLALNQGVTGSTFRRAVKSLIDDDGRVRRERRGDDGRWWLVLSVATGQDPAP